jgi:hypothetical protein
MKKPRRAAAFLLSCFGVALLRPAVNRDEVFLHLAVNRDEVFLHLAVNRDAVLLHLAVNRDAGVYPPEFGRNRPSSSRFDSNTDAKSMKKLALAAAALALAGLGASARAGDDKVDDFKISRITLSASASTQAKPDQAMLRLGVLSEKPTAQEASAANAQAMRETIDMLKAQGVDAKDIQTAVVSLQPVYTEVGASPRPQKPKVAAYRATNQVRVLLRNLETAGAVVAKAIESGANQVDGFDLIVSDRAKRLDGLRTDAVREARRRAQLYADGADMKLGRLLTVEPEADARGPQPLGMMRARMSAAEAPAPIEPGLETIETSVQTTWELLAK